MSGNENLFNGNFILLNHDVTAKCANVCKYLAFIQISHISGTFTIVINASYRS